MADLIDDTDGQEVEAESDEEPTSSIPESAVAEGEDVDVSDPALADIMADDEPGEESADPTESAPVSAPVAAPEESADPASADEEQSFRTQVTGVAAAEDVERIIFLRRAIVERGANVPSLADIAADVTGTQLVAPEGVCDSYGSRPGGRAQGWVSGLSFGSSRRAKRFAKF